jgi:protein-L-isoaspartate O-methyltransferase
MLAATSRLRPGMFVAGSAARGRLIAPVLDGGRQRLTVFEKTQDGVRRRIVADVLYVSLRGRYGIDGDAHD